MKFEINHYMETITLNSHVGEDGILHLDIPVNMVNADLTITIILKNSDDFQQDNKPKGKGWPANFFGSCVDFMENPVQNH